MKRVDFNFVRVRRGLLAFLLDARQHAGSYVHAQENVTTFLRMSVVCKTVDTARQECVTRRFFSEEGVRTPSSQR